jgi:hypothetical protein
MKDENRLAVLYPGANQVSIPIFGVITSPAWKTIAKSALP